MAHVGLVNLTQHLLNQATGQSQEGQTATKSANATGNTGALPPPEDHFTPSARNEPAQAAGLFTVNRSTLFSAAAGALLSKTPAPQPKPANTPAPAAQTTAAANAPAANPPPAHPAAVVATATPNIQNQLQALNNALAALGLDHADILVVDRVASRLQDFNPTAFTSLVYQLEALAQNAAAQQAQATRQAANANPPAAGNQAPAQTKAAKA
jgi:hypothetical protein